MDNDQYSTCPYDKNHVVLTFRMPGHILKCRKNYKGPPMETCMFNATHLIPKGTMSAHLETCRDGHIFNQTKYVEIMNTSRNETTNDSDWN